MDNRPIGVFDSGLGGLTVVKEIKKLLPKESVVYLGDTARVPYGTRSKKTIIKFSLQDAHFLVKQNVKCVVMACNTASSNAYNQVKVKIKLPVFDVVEPAVNASIDTSINKIGVIGTRATILSRVYKKKLEKLGIKVFEKACPLFVPFVEEGETKGKLISGLAKKYLKELKKHKIDMLILACTHYPILQGIISKTIGKHVQIVNPGNKVAIELRDYLRKNELFSNGRKVKDTYFVTDLSENFVKMANVFLGKDIGKSIKRIDLE